MDEKRIALIRCFSFSIEHIILQQLIY